MGLDWLVTMPQPLKGNRNACQWIAAAVCCMAGLNLAGCSQGAATPASQPVLASSSSSAAAEPVSAPPSPFAGASALLTGPDAPHSPVPATSDARNFTTVGPLVVEQQADVVA